MQSIFERLFDVLQDIVSGLMFTQLLSNVVLFGSSLYQFEKVSDLFKKTIYNPTKCVLITHNIFSMYADTQIISAINIGIFYTFHCIFVGIAWTLMLCYHASAVTHAMSVIGDAVYSSNWYLYPVDLRKYLILIICRTQQASFFTGIKFVRVALATFEKVMPTVGFQACWIGSYTSNTRRDNAFAFVCINAPCVCRIAAYSVRLKANRRNNTIMNQFSVCASLQRTKPVKLWNEQYVKIILLTTPQFLSMAVDSFICFVFISAHKDSYIVLHHV